MHDALRMRLTLVHAGVLAAATGILLALSWGVFDRHLERTLPAGYADGVMSQVAWQYVLAAAGLVMVAAGAAWIVAGPLLARVQEAVERQRRFVANASHELRTPLTVIRTEADVTLADPHAGVEELRAMGRVIVEAADRTEELPDGAGTGGSSGALLGLTQGNASLGEALDRVRRVTPQPGLVVIVSDFRDPDGWQRPLRALGARHELLAVEVGDPREAALPDAGELVVVDPETGALVEVHTSDPGLRAAFEDAESARRADVAAALRGAGAQRVALSTGDDWLRAFAARLR